jgi:ATP-dependent Zn protease
VIIPIVLGIGSIVFSVAVWQFLTPAERRVPVAYTDFLAEVHAGRVIEIRIRDREITYRANGADGRVLVKETVGPTPDEAMIDSLKPDDPTKPPPKITFDGAPGERKTLVAYSDFLAEVRAGRVSEITINDREYTYRTTGKDGQVFVKTAVGPAPNQATIDSLKPDDPSKPAPKVTFEK